MNLGGAATLQFWLFRGPADVCQELKQAPPKDFDQPNPWSVRAWLGGWRCLAGASQQSRGVNARVAAGDQLASAGDGGEVFLWKPGSAGLATAFGADDDTPDPGWRLDHSLR